MTDLQSRLEEQPGKKGFYYKNLITSKTIGYHEMDSFEAASVIKIPVMIELFQRFEEGTLNRNTTISIKASDKLPSCGALTYLHDGIEVTLLDLCTLMIILSDNTATNLLIRMLGMDSINQTLHKEGCTVTRLNRLLFDSTASGQGIQNRIAPAEIAGLLEKMYQGKLVSKPASEEMLAILKNQRLNGKIPFFRVDSTKIAHKTGEDDGISHDVGIIFTKEPFVIAFCSEEVYVPWFERTIQDISYEFMKQHGME